VLLFLYKFAWTLFVVLSLPLIPFAKSWRLSERLWWRLPSVPPRRGVMWIHALSVGEVISAKPVVKSLREQYPSKDIVLTVKTSQGMRVARKELGSEVDLLLPMPLDFWWSVRRIADHIRPSLLILVETDIWPGLLSCMRKRGVQVILVNGRVSPRTFRSYRRFRSLSRRVLGMMELCLMQSDLDRKRLLEIGLPPEMVETVGNIKFDRDWSPMDAKEYDQWYGLLHLWPSARVWVAGSTHDGEEEIVLETFRRLVPLFPELRLIIAPRRVDRADDILRLGRLKGIDIVRRSDPGGKDYQTLILDSMGELGRIYGIAEISFVGGSMVPIGGHNLLEPASFGCPVLFGEHTHNFVLMSRLLVEAGGGKRVKDAEDLFMTMKLLLSDRSRPEEMGKRAREFVGVNRGALRRVMGRIGGYIEAA